MYGLTLTQRLLAAVLACSASIACVGRSDAPTPAPTGRTSPHPPYFGQPTPGLTPVRFAPGQVSTDGIELNGVFTPDGREFFFTRLVDAVDTIFHSRLAEGAWSAPRPLMLYSGQAKAVAVDMAVSPDGRELYFLGEHPHEYSPDPSNWDLWVSRLVDGEWGTARPIPPPISTPARGELAGSGDLFFSRRWGATWAETTAGDVYWVDVRILDQFRR